MVRNQKTAGKVARMTSKEAQNMQDDLGNKGGSQKLRETSWKKVGWRVPREVV